MLAYLMWGFSPLFWKQLHAIGSFEILIHRIMWPFAILGTGLLFSKNFHQYWALWKNHKIWPLLIFSAFCIGINWIVYVYAVHSGHLVESSMGYYLNPLFIILFGVVFFKETLRPMQKIAVLFALFGIGFLFFFNSSKPWISLIIAITFALYGLMKKILRLNSTLSLFFETQMMIVPAIIYFIHLEVSGTGHFFKGPGIEALLLFGAGLMTLFPLMLFNKASHYIPLTTIGMLQYFAPTMQLLIGIFIYKETFSPVHLMSFSLIWIGLLIFSFEGVCRFRLSSR